MLTARVWRERSHRYRNEISVCKSCGRRHYPPRAICDRCRSREMESGVMSSTGKVLTWSVIHVAPTAFAQEIPYIVAILQMDDGTRMMAQLADAEPEDVKMDMPIRLEFRKVRQDGRTGIIAYAHKATPV